MVAGHWLCGEFRLSNPVTMTWEYAGSSQNPDDVPAIQWTRQKQSCTNFLQSEQCHLAATSSSCASEPPLLDAATTRLGSMQVTLSEPPHLSSQDDTAGPFNCADLMVKQHHRSAAKADEFLVPQNYGQGSAHLSASIHSLHSSPSWRTEVVFDNEDSEAAGIPEATHDSIPDLDSVDFRGPTLSSGLPVQMSVTGPEDSSMSLALSATASELPMPARGVLPDLETEEAECRAHILSMESQHVPHMYVCSDTSQEWKDATEFVELSQHSSLPDTSGIHQGTLLMNWLGDQLSRTGSKKPPVQVRFDHSHTFPATSSPVTITDVVASAALPVSSCKSPSFPKQVAPVNMLGYGAMLPPMPSTINFGLDSENEKPYNEPVQKNATGMPGPIPEKSNSASDCLKYAMSDQADTASALPVRLTAPPSPNYAPDHHQLSAGKHEHGVASSQPPCPPLSADMASSGPRGTTSARKPPKQLTAGCLQEHCEFAVDVDSPKLTP
eukprot:gene6515-6272_t